MKVKSLLGWYVCFIIPGDTQDDRQDKIEIVGNFKTCDNAIMFIKNVLPKENKDRFFVVSSQIIEQIKNVSELRYITMDGVTGAYCEK